MNVKSVVQSGYGVIELPIHPDVLQVSFHAHSVEIVGRKRGIWIDGTDLVVSRQCR